MNQNARQSASAVDVSADITFADRLLFLLLAIVTCLRPMVSETFQRAELSFLTPVLGPLIGPTPATTTWLDFITLVCAVIVLVRQRSAGVGWRWYWRGVALLAAAVALSSVFAGEKRLALNAGADLLIAVLAGGALIKLMRAAWMPRMMLAAVIAVGVATGVRCTLQKHVYQAAMEEDWRERKEQLKLAGENLNDPLIVSFERRLLAAEPMGFQNHPNVTAALMTMWLLTSLGLAAGHVHRVLRGASPNVGAAVVLTLGAAGLLGYAIWLTGSLAAEVALIGGAALLLVIGFGARFVSTRATRIALGLFGVYVLILGAGATYGVVKGVWPHDSLNVRWQYWISAEKTFLESPQSMLAGVGRENFADAHLRHRTPESTEEVRNPHSLWVSALVELGPLGLAATMVLTVLAVAGVLRSTRESQVEDEAGRIPHEFFVLFTVAVVMLQGLVSGTALAGADADSQLSVLLIWAIEFGLPWAATFAIYVHILGEPKSGLGSPWAKAGLAAGLLAALVQALVGFTLLTPAGATTFAVLTACAIALHARGADGQRAAPRSQWIAVGGGAAAALAYGVVVLAPTAIGQLRIEDMRSVLMRARSSADLRQLCDAADSVVRADPLDAEAPRVAARDLLNVMALPEFSVVDSDEGGAWLRRVRMISDAALRRNPRSAEGLRLAADLQLQIAENHYFRAERDEYTAALRRAVESFERAVALDPNSMHLRIQAGRAAHRLWRETGADEDRQHAIRHLSAALAINDSRPEAEVRRLQPYEVEVVQALLAELAP